MIQQLIYWVGISSACTGFVSVLSLATSLAVLEKRKNTTTKQPQTRRTCSLFPCPSPLTKDLFSPVEILAFCRVDLGCAWGTSTIWRKTTWCHLSSHQVKTQLSQLFSFNSTVQEIKIAFISRKKAGRETSVLKPINPEKYEAVR